MDHIGVGLIGCGVMGSDLSRNCAQLEHARVVAVNDVDRALAEKVAGELQTAWYPDYREMLKCDDIHAVMIAVPGFLHPEAAVAAAESGKHVFCEKPMAVALDGCDAMLAACERHQRTLMIGHVCRYHAVHSRVKQMVLEGRIGVPTCMIVRRLGGGWGGIWAQRWRMKRASSGGTLMEVNAHEIDFMRWVCGEVKRVTARGGQFRERGTDFEDIMLVTLEFESGALGFLHSSSASAIGEYGGRLDGTEGSLRFPSIWGKDAGISHARFDEPSQFLSATEIVVEEPVRAELRAFIDAIQHETPPPITGHDGRTVIEIALAAYQSAATGEPVTLPLK